MGNWDGMGNSATCIDFEEDQEIGGSYRDSTLRFIEIRIEPCAPTPEIECKVEFEGQVVSTVTDPRPVEKYFRDYLL